MTIDQTDFLRTLAGALEEARVRYCVLQRGDALEEELATDHDIDIAVPRGDAGRLPLVIGALWRRGYQPVQLLNHAVHSYAVIFAWVEEGGAAPRTIMVDFTFEHRQCGLIWKSADELIVGRRQAGAFWVAAPETELAYLLLKKLLKDNWKASRTARFGLLAQRLGRERAEAVIAGLFGEKRRKEILEACLEGAPERVLRPLRRRMLWSWRARQPWGVLRYVAADGLRLARRWIEPTGFALAIGDSAEAARLAQWLSPLFGSVTLAARRGGFREWFKTRRLLASTGLVVVAGAGESSGARVLDQLSARLRERHPRWFGAAAIAGGVR